VNRRPLIGITSDGDEERVFLRRPYLDAVRRAGGIPIVLPQDPSVIDALLDRIDGIVLSGGDDPIMEQFGRVTHAKATRVHPDRQQFELTLLDALRRRPQHPVLGICLGMQLMALHARGDLDQHLPESTPTHASHWGRVTHAVRGDNGGPDPMLPDGEVLSHHRQAVVDPGSLTVIARAADGVIEAIRDPARPLYLGVQWHPERTEDRALGLALFERLVAASSVT